MIGAHTKVDDAAALCERDLPRMPGVRFQECDQFEIAGGSECDQSVVSSDGMLPTTNHREPRARVTRNRGFKFVNDDRNMVDAGEHAVRITKNARGPASDASDYPLDRSSAGEKIRGALA